MSAEFMGRIRRRFNKWFQEIEEEEHELVILSAAEWLAQHPEEEGEAEARAREQERLRRLGEQLADLGKRRGFWDLP